MPLDSTYAQKFAEKSRRLTSLAEDFPGDDAPFRQRLHLLFSQIEKEFELVFLENLSLQEKIDQLVAAGGGGGVGGGVGGVGSGGGGGVSGVGVGISGGSGVSNRESVTSDRYLSQQDNETDIVSSKASKSKVGLTTPGSSKIKASHKLKAQTSRIVSSFKTQSIVSSNVREFDGHKDGVWQVATKAGHPIIGTASADHLACIWNANTGRCLLQYQGHSGSVNSIKFHVSKDLVLTGSGDTTAHIWQAAVNWDGPSSSRKCYSSEEELEDGESNDDRDRVDVLRTPLCEFRSTANLGHTSVVVAVDWTHDYDQIITASWDRTAILWDIETREPIHILSGHDHELCHVSSHKSQKLVVTGSRDSTFRLWDFREQMPAVSVFQGHTESVTSTVLTRDDKVVSGSDDKTVKVWELRNMRSPVTTIRLDSAVNRISVSNGGIIAIPHDNRHIRLFDLNGQRIARLPRTSRQGHRRMVSSVAWAEDMPLNLFSSGFDRRVIGWSINLSKDNQ